MNVILISNNLAKAKTLTLTSTHLVLLAGLFFLAAVLLAMGLNYLSLRYADKIDSPTLRSLILSVQQEEHQKTQSYLRDSLNAMAVRMGQMQAQLLRLDSVGARLAELSGIKPQEFLFNQTPGQGGVMSPCRPRTCHLLSSTIKSKNCPAFLRIAADKLGALDSLLMQDRLRKKMLPSVMPVDAKWYSSGFGVRIDPFSGRSAFHEGVDFTAQQVLRSLRRQEGGSVFRLPFRIW